MKDKFEINVLDLVLEIIMIWSIKQILEKKIELCRKIWLKYSLHITSQCGH